MSDTPEPASLQCNQNSVAKAPDHKENAAIKTALLAACPQPQPGLVDIVAALDFRFNGESLFIAFPHAYFAPFYRQNWQTTLESLAHTIFGSQINIVYTDARPIPNFMPPPQQADPFANFLFNTKNAITLAAIRQACAPDNSSPWLLVIICGQSGTGKSTLLSACHAALAASLGTEATCSQRALCFQPVQPPETFWNRCHALLLDDCQPNMPKHVASYLDAGKNAGAHRRAFCAFTGTPSDINQFDSRIASRFRAGIIIELPQADLAMRIAYAEKHTGVSSAGRRSQILQLARSAPNIPALAGLLQKMEFYGRITDQPLSPEELAKLTLPENDGQPADWQRIISQVSEIVRLKPSEIMGASRKHEIVQARMIAMHLCRVRLGLSYQEIGRLFGGKDHATVIYGIRKVMELRQVDKVMHNLLTKLENSSLF